MFKKLFKVFAVIALCSAVLIALAAAYFFVSSGPAELDRDKLVDVSRQVEFLDSEGNVMSEKRGDFRGVAELKSLNAYTVNAFCAVEDKNFYNHGGIDLARMLKAALNNLKAMSFKEGASTITQQLVKNTQLTPEKTVQRKIREIKLARRLEREYSKDEIMEMYLNSIYFGKGAYGIESAARAYFGKSASDLSVGESAILAALIKSPYNYSPELNPESCKQRRNLVLTLMHEQGYIDTETLEKESSAEIAVSSEQDCGGASAYLSACIAEACEVLKITDRELSRSGYRIHTYYDTALSATAEEILKRPEYYAEYYAKAASCIVLCNNESLGISVFAAKSIADVRCFARQPGSILKPLFVYAPAFEKNFVTTATPIDDKKTDFGGYSPSNYDGQYYGNVSVRFALAHSLNTPAVKLLNGVGVDYSRKVCAKLGINVEEKSLTAALGALSNPVPITELLGGYAALANGGGYARPTFICRIEDASGRQLYSKDTHKVRAIREDTAYLITDILKGSVTDGTSKRLKNLNFPVAAKTGTVGSVAGNSDCYSASYTTQHTLLCYVGAREGLLPNGVMGGTSATSMARDFYPAVYPDRQPKDFTPPDSVVKLKIDTLSLRNDQKVQLAFEETPKKYVIEELFSLSNMPAETSDYFTAPRLTQPQIRLKDNLPEITFVASSVYTYKIFRAEDNLIVGEVCGKDGPIVLTDSSARAGSVSEYVILPMYRSESGTEYSGVPFRQKVMVPFNLVPDESAPDDEKNPIANETPWWW